MTIPPYLSPSVALAYDDSREQGHHRNNSSVERQHQHGALRVVGLRNPVQRPLVASGAGTFRNQRDDHVRAHDHVVLVDCTWTMDGGNVAEGHSLSGMVADLHCSSEHGGTTCDARQMMRRGRRT